MKLPRMRTINETLEYIKSLDEGTAVSAYLIRKICKDKKVHCFMTGKKYLIDIDDLIEKMSENIQISS